MRHVGLSIRCALVSVAAAGWVIGAGCVAYGDVLYLSNGDRLTGTLGGVVGGTVTFTTDYAGELHCELGAVKGMTTEAPVAVRLREGKVCTGHLALKDGVQVILPSDTSMTASATGETLCLTQIDAIAREAAGLSSIAAPKDGQEDAGKRWHGTFDAGTSLQSGYTDTLESHFGLTLTRKRVKDTLTLDLSGGYGEVNSEVNTRRVKGGVKWQYYPWEDTYVFGRTALEHDPTRKLELRYEAGVGIGHDMVKTERRTLSLELGGDYAHERWNAYSIKDFEQAKRDARDAADGALRTYFAGLLGRPLQTWTLEDAIGGLQRTSDALSPGIEQVIRSEDHIYLHLEGNFRQVLFTKSVFSERLTVLPSITDFGEYRVASELAFDTPLSEQLGFRLALKTEYESDTGDGDDELTNALTSSLRYAF